MTKLKVKKSATRGTKSEQHVGLGINYVKHLSAIVYDDFCGMPMKVTHLNNAWWITTPGMTLQTLEDYFEGEDGGVVYLCEDGGTVGARALAMMVGKALEKPEDAVDEVMRQRVDSLKRLGATLDVKDEKLTFELRVFSNEGITAREGNFSVWCHLADNFFEKFFDIDAFETKKDAEEWVGYYFDLLESLGMEFTII